ncbi:MFS general substrate transporter [Hysterangium stoloniferum]|nr:MFS general substrate transporter [Hysterangium stoloniferum]
MVSPYNRASGLWTDYFDMESGDHEGVDDGRTQLDKTIDKIGMGSYQWTLLTLCGFGWMADNCWIQTAAIILPRVQQHYDVPDNLIGALNFSLFFGMMFGAIGWGACSDLMGRITAFNGTLLFTALFGVLAGFAPSFFWLCVGLFFLGSAVGGSMPTDGTLLLEHMPNGKQYLLTALSVFFSLGSVISALIGIYIIPRHSCAPGAQCPSELNMGWKYMLIILALMTLSMFIARVVFFRLQESPRYLVHTGRPQDAVLSLRKISRFNGGSFSIDISDVEDRSGTVIFTAPQDEENVNPLDASDSQKPHDPEDFKHTPIGGHIGSTEPNYQSTAISPPAGLSTTIENSLHPTEDEAETDPFLLGHEARAERPLNSGATQFTILHSTVHRKWKFLSILPHWASRPLSGWFDRLSIVLSKEWRATTLLVWWIWLTIALAYTMFNVYLPKLLETRLPQDETDPKTLTETMWDIVIFTLGGCPGALLGAYLIQSPLGRRLSLTFSTLMTAVFCIVFELVESRWAVRASTVGISLTSTTMWAVLYGMTPELFATNVRGTACGTASALSRIGGMAAPLAGGSLLVINSSFPVYTSAIVFTVAGLCVLPLKITKFQSGGGVPH